ncbi:MAG TPA: hypothetical protein VK988_21795 [Acidimicrobiales bacterium]|nr:hypothetical protein [Acidimicrobiales bacterium]
MRMRAGLAKVAEYRTGRNFIRVGDVVRVRATAGKRNGFMATVRAIFVDERTNEVAHVEVFGGRAGQAMVRSFCPERIERVAQTRNGERRRGVR